MLKKKIKIYDAEVDITSFVKDKEVELLEYIDNHNGHLTEAFGLLTIKVKEFVEEYGDFLEIPEENEEESMELYTEQESFLLEAKKDIVKAFIKDLFWDNE